MGIPTDLAKTTLLLLLLLGGCACRFECLTHPKPPVIVLAVPDGQQLPSMDDKIVKGR